MKNSFWNSFEPTEDFIARINENGHTSQRYRLKGHLVRDIDLHHFDEVVFCFRRINTTLSANFRQSGKTFGDLLREFPNEQLEGGIRLPPLRGWNITSELGQFLEWRNFSFFPDQASNDGRLAAMMSMEMSPISESIQYDDEGRSSLEWLSANAKVGQLDKNAVVIATSKPLKT